MKKPLLIFSLFICSFSFIYGQSDSSKHLPKPYLDVSAGVGLAPQAIFMPSDIDYWMDFVQPGFNINVSGGAPLFHSCFGVAGQFSFYSNGYNMDKYMNAIPPQPNTVYTASTYGSFSQYAILVGAFASYTIGKTIIELKVMGGIEDVTLPNYAYITSFPQVPGYTENDTYIYTTSVSATFGGGLQIGYAITKNLSIIYNSDIVIAKVPYNLTAYRNLTASNSSGSGYANVFIFNAALGARYNFGK
ncbi:MAG TPA: hypothetical protein VNZ45_17900 [Bacteroidia bacterium]|jgi:hypothetical protein|nr:hypothetical protein [Bacteroidia bacterium]